MHQFGGTAKKCCRTAMRNITVKYRVILEKRLVYADAKSHAVESERIMRGLNLLFW